MDAETPRPVQQTSSIESALVTVGVLALVVLLLAALNAFPAARRTSLVAGDGAAAASDGDELALEEGDVGDGSTGGDDATSTGDDTTGSGGDGSTGGRNASPGEGKSGTPGKSDGPCKGGATDIGVTADSIKLASTVVDSGIGSSFLGPVRIGMVAVQQKVNREGGICGRTLRLIMKDDGWDRDRGREFIRNLVEDEKVFALAVVPSSEGLDAAANYVEERGVPVVGTDGMLVSQYTKKWIWPVATSTMSLMRIIAKEAYDRGARHFSLVYDRKYRFGIEGAYAFNQAVKRLTGADVPGYQNPFTSPQCRQRFCGIQAGASSYNSEAQVLREACTGGVSSSEPNCDFNALLLEPTEALTWFNSGALRPSSFTVAGHGAGAAQPLFSRKFADECQRDCDRLVVWTGFNPPIERFASIPGVQQYVRDVRAQSPTVDVNNQFLEGGYLGMVLLVDALKKLGPNVTRARLRQVLDDATLDTGLTQPLTFKANHFANKWAQGFRINYTSTFGGWTEITKGWVEDPWVGQDIVE